MRLRTAHKKAQRRRATEWFRESWAACEAGRHKDWQIDWYCHAPLSALFITPAEIVESLTLQYGEPTRVWVGGTLIHDAAFVWPDEISLIENPQE